MITEILTKLEEIRMATAIAAKPSLTIEEAAVYLGTTVSALRHRIDDIPHYKPGKILYFDKADLDRWTHRNKILSNADIERRAGIYCDNNHKH